MSSSQASNIISIIPYAQNYEWGFKGSNSLAGRLWKRTLDVNEDKIQHDLPQFNEAFPYAELWYGTHPSAMNYVLDQHNTALSTELLTKNKMFGYLNETSSLPYLLKVLCNEKILSIQCHPDKAKAQTLYQQNPSVYRDPNHKPEISLALRKDVQAMCGFRQWIEIAEMLTSIEELAKTLGEGWIMKHQQQLKAARDVSLNEESALLKEVFKGLMMADECVVTEVLQKLYSQVDTYLNIKSLPPYISTALKLFKSLHEEYPGDVGCFCPFLLNHVVTQPGDCLYIRPNILHAYVNGQIIECMASSDNVIRGGLTPKAKDLNLLLEILDYSPYKAPLLEKTCVSVTTSAQNTPHVILYDPKIGDFKLYLIHVPAGSNINTPISFDGEAAATLVVLQGTSKMSLHTDDTIIQTSNELIQGHAVVIAAHSKVTFENCNVATKQHIASSDVGSIINFDDIMNGKNDEDFLAVVATGGKSLIQL